MVATYDYRDVDGRLVYQVIRYTPKSFSQRRPDGARWANDLKGVDRLPYRLPELLAAAAAGQTIYVTEGEKDADALVRAGVAATCNSGGAGKWRADFAEHFAGAAEVIVVADKDEPGLAHAAAVQASLAETGIPVRIVQSAAGKDATDHLVAGHGLDELVPVDEADLPEPGLATVHELRPVDGDGDGDQAKKSQATMLAELAETLWQIRRDHMGDLWAVPREGPPIARQLRGHGSLRAELVAAWRTATGKVPSSTAAADALAALEGAATGDAIDVSLRCAASDGKVVVDLGTPGGEMAVIDGSGWTITDQAPTGIVMQRTRLTGEMPIPTRPGDLDALRDHLHVRDEDWPLLLAWLVAAWMADRPCPVLLLHGPHGAGKTSAAEALVRLVDPSPALLRSQPRDDEGWAVGASASRVVAVDNVSFIPTWWSDAICRAVTGDGMVRRRLYSDSEVAVLAFQRAIVLTGIEFDALRPDLADRTIPVTLKVIPEGDRLKEIELEALWQTSAPRMLAGLLDLASAVLRHLATSPRPVEMPRMADYYAVLTAVDAVLGTDATETYRASIGDLEADLAEGSGVVMAIRDLVVSKGGAWFGTPTDLLAAITPEHPPKSWPVDGTRLSGAITRNLPLLARVGIRAESSRSKAARIWSLTMIQPPGNEVIPGDAEVTLEATGDAQRHPQRHPLCPDRAVEAPKGDAGDAVIPTSFSSNDEEKGEKEAGEAGEVDKKRGTYSSVIASPASPGVETPGAVGTAVDLCRRCGVPVPEHDHWHHGWICRRCWPSVVGSIGSGEVSTPAPVPPSAPASGERVRRLSDSDVEGMRKYDVAIGYCDHCGQPDSRPPRKCRMTVGCEGTVRK